MIFIFSTLLTATIASQAFYLQQHLELNYDITSFDLDTSNDERVIVGSSANGIVEIFEHRSSWIKTEDITTAIDSENENINIQFGHSVAISGMIAVVGAPNIYHATQGNTYGSVFIFRQDLVTREWLFHLELTSPIANDTDFGTILSLDQDSLLIGSSHYFFIATLDEDGNLDDIQQIETPENSFQFFNQQSLTSYALHHDTLAIGLTYAYELDTMEVQGAVFIYHRDLQSHEWLLTQIIKGESYVDREIFGQYVHLSTSHLSFSSTGCSYLLRRDEMTGIFHDWDHFDVNFSHPGGLSDEYLVLLHQNHDQLNEIYEINGNSQQSSSLLHTFRPTQLDSLILEDNLIAASSLVVPRTIFILQATTVTPSPTPFPTSSLTSTTKNSNFTFHPMIIVCSIFIAGFLLFAGAWACFTLWSTITSDCRKDEAQAAQVSKEQEATKNDPLPPVKEDSIEFEIVNITSVNEVKRRKSNEKEPQNDAGYDDGEDYFNDL